MTFSKSPINSFSKLHKLKKYLKDIDGYIAGGCFKNIFTEEKIRDIDIFFCDEGAFERAVKVYDDRYTKRKYENDNCIAYYDKYSKTVIELVKKQYSPASDIISKFDFTIVKAALHKVKRDDTVDFEFIYHPKFFEHLVCKKLVIDDSMISASATFNRSLKYTKYGYGLCRESKLDLLKAIIETGNPEDINNEMYFGFD